MTSNLPFRVRHILVVAGDAADDDSLSHTVQARTRAPSSVVVVAPALNSRLRRWTSDEDGARAAAEARLRRVLARLRQDGVAADGLIGDGDPLQAVEDTLHGFPADELVISALHPTHRLVERARSRFGLPVLAVEPAELPRAA